MKNIQMPESFVVAVAKLLYSLEDYDLVDADRLLCDEIEGHITAKLEAMKRRDAFSKYKAETTPAGKENALQAYICHVGKPSAD